MSVTPIIAIYATVISTLALIWQIFTWLKSRAIIKIVVDIIEHTHPNGSPISGGECICRIVNCGGQSASLVEVWAEMTTKDDVLGEKPTRYDIAGVALPIFLNSGQCHIWKFSFGKDRSLRCYAKDAKGRIYKS